MAPDRYTPFSHLSDEQFIIHLVGKDIPTDEDNEFLLRWELLMHAHQALQEQICELANRAIQNGVASEEILQIREITAATEVRPAAEVLQ